MPAAQTKTLMKKIHLISIAFFILYLAGTLAAQGPVDHIQILAIPGSYTVVAENDSSFSYEAEIVLNDTAAFQTVEVSLLEQNGESWQTVQTATVSISAFISDTCATTLCTYRRNENILVICLGASRLFTNHRLELHFNSEVYTINNWNGEF